MRYLDATETFLMSWNEQCDRLLGCATLWRTEGILCLDTIRRAGMGMMRRQPLLRTYVHNPPHSTEGARFVEIEHISLGNIPVRQDDSYDWRPVFHHHFHTRFDTTNGPLWRLVFMPNAYSSHKEWDDTFTKPTGLHHRSKENNISKSEESSAELLQGCALVFGVFHSTKHTSDNQLPPISCSWQYSWWCTW